MENATENGRAPRPVPTIQPDMVFTLRQLRATLGLRKDTAANAVRRGELRVARIDHGYVVLGKWVLEWLEGAEYTRHRRKTAKA